MERIPGWSDVKSDDYITYDKLEMGPHFCVVKNVKLDKFQGKNGEFQTLTILLDTSDKDKQPLFYSNRYKIDAESDATKAKWKGTYKLFIPKNDGSEGDETTKKILKTFITSIERSNPGYDWEKANWDEKTLVGKQFIGVFGLREFETNDGRVIPFTECRSVRSTENDISKINIPKVKLLDNTYKDYEEYMQEKEALEDKKDKEYEEHLNNLDNNEDDSDLDIHF